MSFFNKLESFISDLEREAYLTGAGLKTEANFSGIFENASNLISHDSLSELKASGIDHSEQAEYLSFILSMIIDKALREKTDHIITMELNITVDIDGDHVPFRNLPILVANEPDRIKRAAIDAVKREILDTTLNPLSIDIMLETHRMTKQFGYDSYIDFFETIEGIKLNSIKKECMKLIRDTEDIYFRELDFHAAKMTGVPVGDLAQYDIAYIRRADMFDGMFPANKMLPAAWQTIRSMGIDAENNPFINIDIEPREFKSPRAFCCPVHVPREIYLVIMPHGGVDDYTSFLHELGHTLHFAYTDPELTLAARHLGDNSVTEAYAGTLEHLVFNPLWLEKHLGISDSDVFIRYMKFFELFMLRRYCAKLLYELEFHSGKRTMEECASIYEDFLSLSTGVKYFRETFIQDLDSHFYCARYLRSWMLEIQIRQILEKKYGLEWFSSPEAGELLVNLWSLGQKHRAESISSMLGFDSLNFDPYIQEYCN